MALWQRTDADGCRRDDGEGVGDGHGTHGKSRDDAVRLKRPSHARQAQENHTRRRGALTHHGIPKIGVFRHHDRIKPARNIERVNIRTVEASISFNSDT